MERIPRHPRRRHAGIARRLVIAAVTALTLAVVAAVSIAAIGGTRPERLSDQQEPEDRADR